MLNLQWIKCGNDGHWCNFQNVDLSNVTTQGVDIIWHAGNPSQVVYVGQGDVKARLTAHRSNKEITGHTSKGTLMVTWASVAANQRDGVERYLANTLSPLVGDAHPDVTPVAVNAPWG